jgi:transcriptional regulator with XRE-family HTH domain
MRLRRILAENVRGLRTQRGLSQEDLAHAAEFDRTYISSIERERYSLSIDKLEMLAHSLGVAPHELLMPGRYPAAEGTR